jgi:hypothetical protein
VRETDDSIIYQFTAEVCVEGETADTPHLEYSPETLVIVNKATYFKTEDFAASVSCNPKVKDAIVRYFHEEKVKYNASDITRYVQNIFNDTADIVSLRDQGSVYFVPATYNNVITKVNNLVSGIGGIGAFESIPVPDVQSSRRMVSDAFATSMRVVIEELTDEIASIAANGRSITEKWRDGRITKIHKTQDRIRMYSTLLTDADALILEFDRIVDSLMSSKTR